MANRRLGVRHAALTLYVNEPKQKVDLTKFIERHTFRCVFLGSRGRTESRSCRELGWGRVQWGSVVGHLRTLEGADRQACVDACAVLSACRTACP